MKFGRKNALGWALVAIGVLIAALSPQIVFPGLERLLGIETIVGKENVSYFPDGNYVFTNPGAMVRWIMTVAASGLAIAFAGVCVLFKARRSFRAIHITS